MTHSFFRNFTFVLLAAFLQLATVAASAVELEPLVCNDGSFIVQDTDAKLFDGDDFDQVICPDLGAEINNIGYRSTDGLLYGIKLTPTGNEGIVRIGLLDGVCAIEMLGSGGLPDDERFDAGEVSTDGSTFYVHTGGTDHLYVVDLSGAPTVTEVVYFDDTGNVHDWAYFPDLDPGDAVLFGATTDGHVSRLEVGSGFREDSSSAVLPAGVAYGGARFNAAGELAVYRNSGEIFRIDVSGFPDPVIASEGFGRASTRNDATSCPGCDEAYIMQEVDAELYRTETSNLTFIDPPAPICGPVISAVTKKWSRLDTIEDPPPIPPGVEFNNMCFRKEEGKIYALELHASGNSGLVRFDPDSCVVELLGQAGLPATERFDSGDCWGDNMLVNLGGVHTKFYLVDLGSSPPTSDQLILKKKHPHANFTGFVHDWAVNPADGKLYGGDNTEGQLAILEIGLENGQWVARREDRNLLGTQLPAGTAYGGAWFNVDGLLVLHRNDGELFEIDVSTRVIEGEGNTSFDAPVNDSASCVGQ